MRESREEKDFPLVGQKAWSTVPQEGAPERPHLLPLDDAARDRLGVHAAGRGDTSGDLLIWSPPYARAPRSGLRWGYTVVRDGNDLYAYQRVVYIPERVTPELENAQGTFVLARDRDASAW